MPLISIIVATFNASKTLQKCIDSIAQQSFRDFELIIIDGKSNDGTLDVISRNSEIIDYWVSEQDSGVYNAWNKGLDKATGDWICFIGADDYLWCTSALNDISFKLTTIASETYVAYGRIAVVNKLGEKLYEIGERWIF
jgi:glycosyltransferase involved in cell wall biosynthesis